MTQWLTNTAVAAVMQVTSQEALAATGVPYLGHVTSQPVLVAVDVRYFGHVTSQTVLVVVDVPYLGHVTSQTVFAAVDVPSLVHVTSQPDDSESRMPLPLWPVRLCDGPLSDSCKDATCLAGVWGCTLTGPVGRILNTFFAATKVFM